MVKTDQAWAGMFVARDASGEAVEADALPVGTLYVDGTANGAAVTITGSGPYKWAVTLPALTAGQRVEIHIAATIDGVATASVIAGDQADTVLASDLAATLGAAGAGLTALGDARLANLDAAVSTRSTYAGGDTAGTTTLLSRITALLQTKAEADTAHGLLATAASIAALNNLSAAQVEALLAALNDLSDAEVETIVQDAIAAAGLTTHAALTQDEIDDLTATIIAAVTAAAQSGQINKDGANISRPRAATWSVPITGLGAIAADDVIVVSIKRSLKHTDAMSVVQWRIDLGADPVENRLTVINGAPAGDNEDAGGIAVDDDVAGDITVTITDAAITAGLPVKDDLYYDVKRLAEGGVPTEPLRIGQWSITAVVTLDVE